MKYTAKHRALACVASVALTLGLCPGIALAANTPDAVAPQKASAALAAQRVDAMEPQAQATIGEVRTQIQALKVDPTAFTAAERGDVDALWQAYLSLSESDRAILDAEESHPDIKQPLGRVLEAALWAVHSYDEVDNSTTLPDNTYDATTTPALSAVYSKGKSTSSRQRPWSVKSVQVKNGRAYATVAVESNTYSAMWKGGVTYPKTNTSGNCEFASVPIDLNSTFYFAGVSESMPVPIAFSLTTEIQEPDSFSLSIINNTGMFKADSASIIPVADGSATLVMALSGTSYEWLYMGTYEQAVADNAQIAEAISAGENKGNVIGAATNADGKLEFRIPLKQGQSYVPCVAISKSYYDKFLKGQNAQERSYYARQFEVEYNARMREGTLVTGDYDEETTFAVSTTLADFNVAPLATTQVAGGPNNNNFKIAPMLAMTDDTYDKVTYPTVVSEQVSTATAEIDISKNTFAISLQNAPGKIAFEDKVPVAMTFHVAKSAPYAEAGTDVLRYVTINMLAKTISITGDALHDTSDKVVQLIEALPSAAEVGMGDETVIAEARAAYDELTDAQKARVDETRLLEAELALAQLKKAAADAAAQEAQEAADAARKAADDDPEDVDKKLAAANAVLAAANAKAAAADAAATVAERAQAKADAAQAKATASQAAADKAAEDAQAAQAQADADGAAAAAAKTSADEAAAAAAEAQAQCVEAAKVACEAAGIAYDESKSASFNMVAAHAEQVAKMAELQEDLASAEAARKAAADKAANDVKVAQAVRAKAEAEAKAAKTAKAAAEKKAAAALKANPMTVKVKTVKAKAAKKTTIAAKKAFAVAKAQGKVKFYKVSGNAKVVVKASGKVLVKPGLKKGKTVKAKVLVVAAGNKSYAPATKTVVLKVKIGK